MHPKWKESIFPALEFNLTSIGTDSDVVRTVKQVDAVYVHMVNMKCIQVIKLFLSRYQPRTWTFKA